ncbi:MAG: TrkA family potassium uptake protein [Cyanobacteria bacterium QH_9_48_43]|nr:MAG: TrkA family potassium uptake protein [Cyanobacteria bacterium QH_1_48_107]PSO65806.1 MAG: TrkA family potassium uptake protein [Cyanobacteria bacterium QH_2_48_84]PSO70255.1 MAG: TrkA family potassium uptake protein [Cyanobacteria bacterium QH_3_48_40]PSO71772.1 MAG: TrkA family potassium uptake protein [Cyanobacteria bacterium QS_1_48_34]PSO76002.1 MAG: TrkA family potassium uptake protein [Cyanobacteria bacterium QS_4_48_99]PSO85429.1 MAG: TrkA family potassium uptake protein [Cyanob
MYIVIVGAGPTGRQIVELATADQHEVVVVESNEERAGALSAEFDCLVLHGDAASRPLLEEAGVPEADALIATTDDDATNLMVMMLGREMEVTQLLSSISDPSHGPLFENLGVHRVENLRRLSGRQFYRTIQRPQVRDFMELGNSAEIVEIMLEAGSPLTGTTLQEAGQKGLLPNDVIVVAINRGEELHVPRGDTTLQVGDIVTILASKGVTDALMATFGSQT